VLLIAPTAAQALEPDLPARLGAMSTDEAREALVLALGVDDAALWVRWPHVHDAAQAAPPGGAAPGAGRDPHVTVGHPGQAGARRDAAREALAATGRLARRAGGAGAAVLRATLPEPTARAPRGHQPWVAAAVLLLPMALLAFALVERARHTPPPSPPEARMQVAVTPPDEPAAPPAVAADGRRALERLESVAVLPGSPDKQRRVVVAAGQTYVLDTGRNVVERFTGGTWQPVLRRGTAVGARVAGNLLHLFWLPPPPGSAGGRVTALDAAGQLWALDGATATPVARSPRPAWLRVERAAGFRGELFAVEIADDQIWHYRPDAAAFPSFTSAGRSWLESEADMAGIAAIGVDGAVYLLWADGRMAKYALGREQAFAASAAVPPPFDASALYTSATAGRLLVADRTNGQVVVLTPGGELVERLAGPSQPAAAEARHQAGNIDRLHDVWWDEGSGALYLLSGNTLLRAPYGPR